MLFKHIGHAEFLIELEEGTTDESWIQEYSDETGEDVSFF